MPQQLALGPFHPAWPAALRLDLEVESGVVRTVESTILRPEWLRPEDWAGLSLEQGLAGVERLCAPSSWAYTLVYCQALESLAGLEVPPRARYLRVLLAELERPIRHLLVAADILELLGLHATALNLLELREAFLEARQHLVGRRFFPDLNVPGGLRRDLQDLSAIGELVRRVKATLYRLVDQVLSQRAFATYMVGAGLLTKELAAELGLGGPLARASELVRDLRLDQPYAAYDELAVQIVTQNGGDAFSRWVVLLLETFESLRLLEEVGRSLPPGPVHRERELVLPAGKSQSWVEAPSGPLSVRLELEHKATVDSGWPQQGLAALGRISSSPLHLTALPRILPGQQVRQVGVIVASWGLCQPCLVR
ncbi:MAG: hypothetical protein JXA37_09015 [Chloroflexia bacterium]|nr:hypothetical protein [Chloroflexia bacterium]